MNILSQIRTLKIVQNMPKMAYQFNSVCVESSSDLHFVAIWQTYKYLKSDKNFKNCQKYAKMAYHLKKF